MRNANQKPIHSCRRASGEINPLIIGLVLAFFLTPALYSLMQYFHLMAPPEAQPPMGVEIGLPKESKLTPKRGDFYMPEANMSEKPARNPGYAYQIGEGEKDMQSDFPQTGN